MVDLGQSPHRRLRGGLVIAVATTAASWACSSSHEDAARTTAAAIIVADSGAPPCPVGNVWTGSSTHLCNYDNQANVFGDAWTQAQAQYYSSATYSATSTCTPYSYPVTDADGGTYDQQAYTLACTVTPGWRFQSDDDLATESCPAGNADLYECPPVFVQLPLFMSIVGGVGPCPSDQGAAQCIVNYYALNTQIPSAPESVEVRGNCCASQQPPPPAQGDDAGDDAGDDGVVEGGVQGDDAGEAGDEGGENG
jgi:hypothetical protein